MIDILVDCHYGDSGKGRVVDYLVGKHNYSAVARWAGGNNCGHTLVVNGKKTVLHLLPSGVLDPNVNLYMGSQMVIDPVALEDEIKQVEAMGINVIDRLFISSSAHIVTNTHRIQDGAREDSPDALGTTRKGIGPCYADKAARVGKRMSSILDQSVYYSFKKCIKNDISALIAKERYVLCEGAQGYKLDIDHGDYPYVTSSNAIAASACVSLGFSPKRVNKIWGVTKAYCTRVGEGPFPAEIHGKEASTLRALGNEYGATTGRPRRVGWLDLDILKQAVMVNGITDLVLTKADILNNFGQVQVLKNGLLSPIESWSGDFSSLSQFHQLPDALIDFVYDIETFVNAKVTYVSVGPDRLSMVATEPELKDSDSYPDNFGHPV
jgi:adenylosuccinate synthase